MPKHSEEVVPRIASVGMQNYEGSAHECHHPHKAAACQAARAHNEPYDSKNGVKARRSKNTAKQEPLPPEAKKQPNKQPHSCKPTVPEGRNPPKNAKDPKPETQ